MTPRQKDLLDFIRRHMAESGGVVPSYREMAAAVGASGPSQVHRMIVCLDGEGHIARLPNRRRAIALRGQDVATPPTMKHDLLRLASDLSAYRRDRGEIARAIRELAFSL